MTYKLMVISSGGVHLNNFSRLMHESGAELFIVSDALPDLPFAFGYARVSFSLRSPRQYSPTIQAIREAYRAFLPDVVHVHQLNSVAFFAIKALQKFEAPIAATAWGSDVLVQPQKGFLHRRLLRYSLKRAKAFTSDSAHMAAAMQSFLPEKKLDVTVCNFGVEPVPMHLPKEDLIYSNRLHNPLYRIDKVIEAFARFCKTDEARGWRLVVAATGSDTEPLRAQAEATGLDGRIYFAGWVQADENRSLYARAKVWVSVPESDATAISLLEAMYYGCYPVVSDLPVAPEWVDDGVNGRIVRDLDANFFEGISKVDFDRVAGMNRSRIEQDGTTKVAAEKFSALHHRLMAKRS